MPEARAANPKSRFRPLRAACFCCVFAAVFLCVQFVLVNRDGKSTMSPDRFDDYARQAPVDVLFFGSSTFQFCYSPSVIWNETGATSYNMSLNGRTAMTTYYDLRALLQAYAAPKYIVFQLADLCNTRALNAAFYKYTYHFAYQDLPSLSLRAEYMLDALKRFNTIDAVGLLTPFFLFHNRWLKLTAEDFMPDKGGSDYQPFMKGFSPRRRVVDVTQDVAQYAFKTEPASISALSAEYFERCFALCREAGITPVVIQPVRFDQDDSQTEQVEAFCEANGVIFINYMSDALLAEMDWNYATEFSDCAHFNLWGGLRMSQHLAHMLSDTLNLEDYRQDPAYADWNADRDDFFEAYKDDIIKVFGQEYYDRALGG